MKGACRKYFICFVCLAMSLALSANSQAAFQKTKIAVLDFEMQGEGHETADMGEIVAEWLITAFVKKGRFEVVERRMLKKILSEQQLTESGIINEKSAGKLGKILGVKTLITGSVMKLKNVIEVNARIIDAENASIIAAETISSTTAMRLEELIAQMAEKIMQDFPLEGYVVFRKEKEILIDLGHLAGVTPGMQFVVYQEGEAIKHPKTGKILDVRKIEIGWIEITRVRDKISESVVIQENAPNAIQYGMMVKSRSMLRNMAIETATQPADSIVQPPSVAGGQSSNQKKAVTPKKYARFKKYRAALDQNPAYVESPAGQTQPDAQMAASTVVVKRKADKTTSPYKIGVFPPVLRRDADMLADQIESAIKTNIKKWIAQSQMQSEPDYVILPPQTATLWASGKPVVDSIVNIGRQMQLDGALLYYISFQAGQGLANGWGVDFINADIRVYLIDIADQAVYVKKDRMTNSRDQLSIALGALSKKLLNAYEHPDGENAAGIGEVFRNLFK